MLTMSSGLLGFLFASDYDSGFIIGQVYAVIINPVICFMILYSKNLMSNFALIILSILSGILTMIGGSLLGLIPAAYLTTKGLDN